MSATTRQARGVVVGVVMGAALALGCGSGGGAAPPTYAQADLTGEWDVLQLTTNSAPRWGHTHIGVAADGKVTLRSILEDGGPVTLPTTFDLKLAISADGVVTTTGADAGPGFHGTMTSKKTLVFATGTEDTGAESLFVIRKRVPGVTFAAADLASVAFDYHAITAGRTWSWEYGDGTTDASGALTIPHQWDASGPIASPPPPGFATLTIDADGVVGFAGAPGVMRGVMAADKKSLFLLQTPDSFTPTQVLLIVVTLTGKGFTAADLAGQYRYHLLSSGASTATSAWYHGAFGVSALGVATFTDLLSSSGSTVVPAPFTLAIDAGGTITRADDASFHGHMAWNGDFYVRTGDATDGSGNGFMALCSR